MDNARVSVHDKLTLLRPPRVVSGSARSRGLPLNTTFPLLGVVGGRALWLTRSRGVYLPIFIFFPYGDVSLSELCHWNGSRTISGNWRGTIVLWEQRRR